MSTINKVNESVKRYESHINTSQDIMSDSTFKVSDKVKSEFDMWVWIYQEIANLRMEISRLGLYVRCNTSSSPNYLKAYHAHIMSFLIDVGVVLSSDTWDKVERFYNKTEEDINTYFTVRANVPNKKIPEQLIKNLDKLYRVALICAQKAGLGFKVSIQNDFEAAVEKAITVS